MDAENINPRILLVDDDERNLRILELILEDEFELSMASTGEQALERVSTFRPDIVLLDIMMPGITGIEACKEIKSSPEHKNIKIILLSGMSMTEDRIAGYEAGADDYLTKPFNDEELLAKVRVYAKLKFSEEINRLKTDFLSLITHETSTPLNTIIGYATLMAGDEMDEEKKSWLDDIKSSASMLHNKIERILMLSSLMSTDSIGKSEISLSELFMVSVDNLGFDEEKNSHIDIQIDENEVIFCDQILFQKALTSLLDNSIRHTPDESRTICRCSYASNEYLEISIEDQGPGIEETRLVDMFEAFNIPDLLNHGQGLALSMSLCRQIVTLHGGTISASNGEEGGLRILIKIPYEPTGSA